MTVSLMFATLGLPALAEGRLAPVTTVVFVGAAISVNKLARAPELMRGLEHAHEKNSTVRFRMSAPLGFRKYWSSRCSFVSDMTSGEQPRREAPHMSNRHHL